MINQLELNAAMEGDKNKRSFYLEQCRSIWVPQNWTWLFLLLIGCVTIYFPLLHVLLAVWLMTESCHLIENFIFEYDDDTISDRSCFAMFYKFLAIVIICLVRCLLQLLGHAVTLCM